MSVSKTGKKLESVYVEVDQLIKGYVQSLSADKQAELTLIQDNIEVLSKKLVEKQKSLTTVTDQVEEANSLKQTLEKAIASMELEKKEVQIKTIEEINKLSELVTEREAGAKEVATQKEIKQRLDNTVAGKKKEIATALKQLDKVLNETDQKTTDLQALNTQIETVKKQAEADQAAFAVRLKGLQEEEGKAQTLVTTLGDEVGRLRDEISIHTTKLDELLEQERTIEASFEKARKKFDKETEEIRSQLKKEQEALVLRKNEMDTREQASAIQERAVTEKFQTFVHAKERLLKIVGDLALTGKVDLKAIIQQINNI